jgi:hypothetical protein
MVPALGGILTTTLVVLAGERLAAVFDLADRHGQANRSG